MISNYEKKPTKELPQINWDDLLEEYKLSKLVIEQNPDKIYETGEKALANIKKIILENTQALVSPLNYPELVERINWFLFTRDLLEKIKTETGIDLESMADEVYGILEVVKDEKSSLGGVYKINEGIIKYNEAAGSLDSLSQTIALAAEPQTSPALMLLHEQTHHRQYRTSKNTNNQLPPKSKLSKPERIKSTLIEFITLLYESDMVTNLARLGQLPVGGDQLIVLGQGTMTLQLYTEIVKRKVHTLLESRKRKNIVIREEIQAYLSSNELGTTNKKSGLSAMKKLLLKFYKVPRAYSGKVVETWLAIKRLYALGETHEQIARMVNTNDNSDKPLHDMQRRVLELQNYYGLSDAEMDERVQAESIKRQIVLNTIARLSYEALEVASTKTLSQEEIKLALTEQANSWVKIGSDAIGREIKEDS